MAQAKDCPRCGLVNPPTAQRCDCGYDFVTRSVQGTYDHGYVDRRLYKRRMAYIACIVGCSFLSVHGLMSTLDPRPDGRLLNTAPSLGFDVFLPVGVIGVIVGILGLIVRR